MHCRRSNQGQGHQTKTHAPSDARDTGNRTHGVAFAPTRRLAAGQLPEQRNPAAENEYLPRHQSKMQPRDQVLLCNAREKFT